MASLQQPGEFAIGSTLDGRYRLDRLLGRGGMGAVYEATDLRLRRRTALKALHTDLLSHPTARSRMEGEARALGAIQHPNVVEIRNIFELDGVLVIELELVLGGTLAHLISAGRRSATETVQLVVAILAGLDAIHRAGLVHRDLKPANVLLTETGVPKIADLGVAHELGVKGRTKTGTRLGTPEYMSPEQVKGLPVSVRADVYALGIVIYEMLTGSVPFQGDSEYDVMEAHVHHAPDLEALRRVVPEALVAVVAKALEKSPEARWGSAAEFADALSESLRAGPVAVPFSAIVSPVQQAAPVVAGGFAPTAAAPPIRTSPASNSVAGILLALGGLVVGGVVVAAIGTHRIAGSAVRTSPPAVVVDPVWNMNRQCDSSPGLRLTSVSIVGGETVVVMRATNTGATTSRIQTAAPGSSDAFVMEDSSRSRRFGLKRVSGISISPSWTSIEPGSSAEFTLYFPDIDRSWSPFDLREGDKAVDANASRWWLFKNVVLE